MLSSVLRSPRAIQANIAIMRAFVRVRALLVSNEELARKLEDLEKKYDAHFKIVFDAIRELMSPPAPQPRAIGFRSARGAGARGKPPGALHAEASRLEGQGAARRRYPRPRRALRSPAFA
jgi:hypothetical protein